MPFSALGLSSALLKAIETRPYAAPTPVQSAAIPAALAGRDVLASAQTGSGKTLAFLLPLLQQLDKPPAQPCRALVLVPTRELAMQVGEELASLGRCQPRTVKVSVLFGGVSINTQMLGLRGGAEVVIATPGRLLDLVERNALTLGEVRTLVLDEADRLLDLGFADELGRVLGLLPTQRQNLFFSATFPPAVRALAQALLDNPVRVEVADAPATVPNIVQRAIAVDAPRRTQLLRHLIESSGWRRVLVFVATQYAADRVADKLRRAGIAAESFHGALSQGKRAQVLADFKAARLTAVIATDVAARGLDVVKLAVVVNYDLPRSPVDYTHRIGRTGRAGERGLAVSFVSADATAHFRVIEKRQRLRLPLEEIADFEPVAKHSAPGAAADGDSTGGIKGRRPSKKDKLRAASGKN